MTDFRLKFILILFLVALMPASASADLCRPKNLEELQALAASPGSPVKIISPQSRHLMTGVTTKVEISTPNDSTATTNLRYRIFYTKHSKTQTGEDTVSIEEISGIEVSATAQATTVVFRPNVGQGYTSLVIVGCSSSEALTPDALPPHFAVINTSVTGPIWGIIAAVTAMLLMVAILGLVARWNQSKYEMTFSKALLYCFANFRREVSLSRVQLFVFTFAVVGTVAYYCARSGQLTDLSTDVLMLLGISSAGAVGGAWGDAMKNRLSWESWRWLDRHGAFRKLRKDLPLNLGQAIRTRGEFDLYRFQALIFTFLVAPAFVFASVYTLGSAEIPPGILAVLGLSQVTYLVGKLADTPTVTDFDKSVAETRRKLKEGAKLTERGINEIKEQFQAAMGMEWARDPVEDRVPNSKPDIVTTEDEVAVEDALKTARTAAEAAEQAAVEARIEATTKTDAVAANIEANFAEKAMEAAAEALKMAETANKDLHNQFLVNIGEVKEAVRSAEQAKKTAEERLSKIKAMP